MLKVNTFVWFQRVDFIKIPLYTYTHLTFSDRKQIEDKKIIERENGKHRETQID